MAIRRVSPPAGQQRKATLEACQQRRRRQHGHTRRGQLERERQTIEPPADSHDRINVVGRQGEAGLRRLGAQDEQRNRGPGRRGLGRGRLCGRWQDSPQAYESFGGQKNGAAG